MPTTAYRIPVEQTFAWQQPIKDMRTTNIGLTPAKGDRYIVKATATDAFAGKEKKIATYDGAAWLFDTPVEGWTVTDLADHLVYRYDSTGAWSNDDVSGKADKVTTPSPDGELAGLDTNGNLTDSGLAISDVSTAVSEASDAYAAMGSYDADYKAIIMNL